MSASEYNNLIVNYNITDVEGFQQNQSKLDLQSEDRIQNALNQQQTLKNKLEAAKRLQRAQKILNKKVASR